MTPLCHDLEEAWDDEIDLAPPGYVSLASDSPVLPQGNFRVPNSPCSAPAL